MKIGRQKKQIRVEMMRTIMQKQPMSLSVKEIFDLDYQIWKFGLFSIKMLMIY